MAYIVTPNMNLLNPGVGTEPGPQFALDISTSINLIDAHDHTPGNGIAITPGGMNINTDLSFGNNNITNLQSAVFSNTSVTTLNAIYVSSGELWFNDTTNPVQITKAGAVNATSSGISSGAATAAFAGGVLQVYSNASTLTPGNIQGGSLLLGNNTASSPFLTLAPPTLGGNYTLTLPALPGSTSLILVSAVGVMNTASLGSTLSLSGSTLSVATGSITNTQVSATAAISSSKLSNPSTTNATAGSYSNSTSTFTTIVSQTAPTGASGSRPIGAVFSGPSMTFNVGNYEVRLIDTTSSTTLYTWAIGEGNALQIPISSFTSIIANSLVAAGDTVALQARALSASAVTLPTGARIDLIAW